MKGHQQTQDAETQTLVGDGDVSTKREELHEE